MDSNGLPLLGALISLTSKSNIRFVGTLLSINPQEGAVSLEQVRSYGTEGRALNPMEEIMPSDHVFPQIMFKASDISDLRVLQPRPQSMPIHPPSHLGGQQPGYPPLQNGHPGMNPYYPYQQGVGYQHPPPQQYWSNPSQQHQQPSAQHPTFVRMPQSVDTPTTSATTVPDTSNAASSPSLGSNALQKSSTEKFNNSNAPLNAHGGSRPANNSGPATVSQTSSVPKSTQDTSEAVAKSLGQMKIGGEPPSKDSGVTKKNPGLPKPTQSNQARKSQAKHTDLPQENTDLLALPPKPPVVKAGGNTTQDRDQQQTNDGNRHSRGHRGTNRSYHNDRYNRNFQNQRTQKTEIPDSEFDFESSNAKFDRAIPEQAQTEATLNSDAQFYSKGGFFDNISCDSRDRVEGQWIDRHTRATQERQTNMETFGQTGSSRGGHQRRYNNNRGSYYHNNNNANGSSFKQFNNETGGNKTVNSSGDGSNGANYNRRSRGRNDQQYDHRNAGDSKNTAAPQTTNTSQS